MVGKPTSLENVSNVGGLNNLLHAIGEDSPEILTAAMGVAVSGVYGPMAGMAATVGVKLLHASLKGQAWQQIAFELKKLKDAGKIQEGFIESDLGRACITELLDAIDQNPDPRRIEALRNVFLRIAMEPAKDVRATYQQQLLHIVASLSSGEVVLLSTIYRVGGRQAYTGALEWQAEMARETGFMDMDLVELNEIPLIEKHLVLPRKLSDKSGISWGNRNRLTTLGERVCEYMVEGK